MLLPPTSQGGIRLGAFEVNLKSGELYKEELQIRLQEQPFHVLLMLLEHRGEVVTREELRQALWPRDTFVDFDQGLNRAIKKLREALGDSAEHPRYIETLPKRGYRLIAPLEDLSRQTPSRARPGGVRLLSRRRARLSAAAVAGLLAAGFALHLAGIHLHAPGRDEVRPPPGPAEIESIAVLPFENLSSDAELEGFADGMTDSLITKLGEAPSLRVISRQSIIRYKRSKKSLREISQALKADAVVEGTVQHSGNRLRINIQLVQTGADRHLWAKTYETSSKDFLTVEEEVTQDVFRQIETKLTIDATTAEQTK
jgi:TolB-like protein/DNA-binding winged helix-turn-helix (wHTH) protein